MKCCKLLDCTHVISPEIPTWGGCCGFGQTTIIDYNDCTTTTKFRVQKICMDAGLGTHMDAPAHCIAGGRTIADFDITELFAPCLVIDVSAKAHAQYLVTPQDILDFEKKYGIIEPHTFVIFFTGWEKFWNEPEKYRNDHQFPAVSAQAAQLLVERNVVGIGIDTLGPDWPGDTFPVHDILLGADKYIVENIANAGKLPATGAYSLVMPLKIAAGTEAPVRLVAFIAD